MSELHLPYESLMRMPSSRRYRAMKEHINYVKELTKR